MTTRSETRKPKDQREYAYNIAGRWVTHITQFVTAGITSALTAAITVVVTILVLLGGLWLAYTYLPMNVFYIILAVLVVDMVLGIVLRAVLYRR
jgi:Flp pilus assembly protein TadB